MKVLHRGRLSVVMIALMFAAELVSTAPGSGTADDGGGAVRGRLFYVTHALSHDIAAFRLGQDSSPKRVGDLVTTGDGSGPASILFAPDGRTAYVANRTVREIAAYRVGPAGELTLLATEPTGGTTPFSLAITPNGTSLFTANLLSGTVTAFTINADGTLKRAGDPVPTGFPLPRGLGVSPDGRFLYVGHGMPTLPGPDAIVRFAIKQDGTLGRAGRPVPTSPSAAGMVFTPDGRYLYAATQFEAKVDGFRVGKNGDLTPVPGSPFDTLTNAEGAAIAPDGRHLFIASPGDQDNPDVDPGGVSVYAINGDGSLTEVTGSPLIAGQGPVGIDATPDGRRLLVAGSPGPGRLSTFSIGSDGRLDPITNPPIPTGGTAPRFQSLAVLPNQGPLAALTVQAGGAGQAIRFDASIASDPDGRIARFDWDFGDGTILRDGGPVPTHTYRRPGRFTATVTVTDDENCSTALVFTGTTVHCNGSARARASHTVIARL